VELEVDLLIGTNSDEFRLFLTPTGVLDRLPEDAARATAAGYGLDPETALAVYRVGRPKATPGELLAATATDWFYRIPAIRLAEAHLRHRAGATFLYEFACQPPTFDGRLGACHASELPFVFGNLQDPGFTALIGTRPPQQLADTMHGAWVAFATTGDPGWAPYDTADRTTMRFDTTSSTVTDPRAAERTLWDGHR
jgi:para-nitrobenzyl esterase